LTRAPLQTGALQGYAALFEALRGPPVLSPPVTPHPCACPHCSEPICARRHLLMREPDGRCVHRQCHAHATVRLRVGGEGLGE